MSDTARLAAFLEEHAPVLVITGAGCSTASGIGDYRDADGDWKRAAPVQMQDFVQSHAVRQRYWARSMHGWPAFSRARPNAAHLGLATLESRGLVGTVITQNVDGLHQRAGHGAVLELHGNLSRVVCLGCALVRARGEVQVWLERANPFVLEASAALAPDGDADLVVDDLSRVAVPDCPTCGGTLKPDVVFYGDSVPRDLVARAYGLVDRARGLLVVGSSLMVFSSYRFVKRARERSIPIAALNRGRTRADAWFALKLEEDCAEVLDDLAGGGRRPPAIS